MVASPLYSLTKNEQPFHWEEEEQQIFDAIKQALLEALALEPPDASRSFHLYVAENRGTAKGELTQWLGPWKRPVAYLLKKLDPVTAGWPACLWIVVAVVVLVKDADKLTQGQNLTVTSLHALVSIVCQPPDGWLTNARMTHYQTLLLNPDLVTFTSPVALNTTTLSPNPDPNLNPPA